MPLMREGDGAPSAAERLARRLADAPPTGKPSLEKADSAERPRAGEIPLVLQQAAKEVKAPRRIGMLRTEFFLADHQRAPTEPSTNP